uniref:Uncharacterized protein n=1 Tax=Oreochromis niloticus TaxID=8128 RepID=A0A669DF57_ORENI
HSSLRSHTSSPPPDTLPERHMRNQKLGKIRGKHVHPRSTFGFNCLVLSISFASYCENHFTLQAESWSTSVFRYKFCHLSFMKTRKKVEGGKKKLCMISRPE